jgi:hypothetical protein
VNAQELKLPLALVLQDVPTLLPSKVTVMVACGTKPLPLTAALLPTRPSLGVRLMPGLAVSGIRVACACRPPDSSAKRVNARTRPLASSMPTVAVSRTRRAA